MCRRRGHRPPHTRSEWVHGAAHWHQHPHVLFRVDRETPEYPARSRVIPLRTGDQHFWSALAESAQPLSVEPRSGQVRACGTASTRPVAACAAIAGRFAPVLAWARAAAHRRAVSGHCRPPAACRCRGRRALTRWCVARGGGPGRGAGRRGRSCGAADGLAPPAPAARDRRRAGLQRRAVPARG